ncbi:hypothetical protein HDU81_004856 [Chytriomyces hyalinus]|nr:hypothetical protein HDU81_004856 [Chytriomyces hyalinus]
MLQTLLCRTALQTPRASLRCFSTSTSDLDRAFHKAADIRMQSLLDDFDAIGEQCEAPGFDVVYSNGVLTMNTGISGTYVINKQPPNRQIWLSSPISGPKRYDHVQGSWIDSKKEDKMEDLLEREMKIIFKGIDVSISK